MLAGGNDGDFGNSDGAVPVGDNIATTTTTGGDGDKGDEYAGDVDGGGDDNSDGVTDVVDADDAVVDNDDDDDDVDDNEVVDDDDDCGGVDDVELDEKDKGCSTVVVVLVWNLLRGHELIRFCRLKGDSWVPHWPVVVDMLMASLSCCFVEFKNGAAAVPELPLLFFVVGGDRVRC